MSITNSIVAIYDTHQQAEHAIKELQEAGVDMKSLSTNMWWAITTPATV
jgi:hypothetical protein